MRLLLDRYGVLFRELLTRELPHLQWPALFRAMRALEWSGELLAGHFFAGLGGPQFASPEAFRRLQAGLPEDEVFWLCAVDPASPCGLGLELGLPLPRRLAGSHMVFHGSRLLVVSQRHGRELTLLPGHEHERAFDFLAAMLGRACQPRTAVEIETINGAPAPRHGGPGNLGPNLEQVGGPGRLYVQKRY